MISPLEGAARLGTTLDSRSISFENPTGARGAGGPTDGGRKGAPEKLIAAGARIVLADIQGPGRIRHIWMTFPPSEPQDMRAVWMEVYYDDLTFPSISVPCLDFFGLPHGRAVAYDSALTSVHQGRGFNAYFPMPFRRRIRIELTNSMRRTLDFYYQIDYTLESVDPDDGYLHVSFHRENPTVLRRDFVIAAGLTGPGRFLGSAVGIRVFQDGMDWYGEGEFKFYRDGDSSLPTICGTGLEDYVGSAWGMSRHTAFYAGAPIYVEPGRAREPRDAQARMPDFVSFYRWHLPDPLVFRTSFRATIQQIGSVGGGGDKAKLMLQRYVPAGPGWALPGTTAWNDALDSLSPEERQSIPRDYVSGMAERRDDYSAAAFVYCREPQPVPRLNIAAAVADIELRPYEPRAPHP